MHHRRIARHGQFISVWAASVFCLAVIVEAAPPHLHGNAPGWQVARSENFQVSTRTSQLDLADLCRACEQFRQRLTALWTDGDAPVWTPCCEIVVHATLADYHRAVGAGAGKSVGCTTISMAQGRISQRRIDLRLDADGWRDDALPHELTHVVLADRFGAAPLPLWADEGMAVLAESARKQQARASAALHDSRHRAAPGAAALLFDTSLPQQRRDAFYACSAELVSFLVDRKHGPGFIEFLHVAQQRGYEHALRQEYGIDGVTHLQTLWREHQAPRVAMLHEAKSNLE